MKATHHIFVAMILGYVCSGCLKFEHHITSPAARGVVLDARTRSPLSGAEVVVSRTQFSTNAPTVVDALANTRLPVVITGKSGRFRVPAEGHWKCVVDYLIAPLHKPDGTLVVRRPGYESAAIPLWGDIAPISAPQRTNFIEVLLNPVPK